MKIRYLFLFLFLFWGNLAVSFGHAQERDHLLNVSHDPTRELYKEINEVFAQQWEAQTGRKIDIQTSHAGSATQARAVINGLRADVVTLSFAPDIDQIAQFTQKIPANWASLYPFHAAPHTTTVVFLVRKGNPKNIRDWSDLMKKDVSVILANPKTSGTARWAYLAANAYADEHASPTYLPALLQRIPVLDSGARAATLTFVKRGIGDVLVTLENEALQTQKEMAEAGLDIIVPSLSLVVELPVAIVEGQAKEGGTWPQAKAYVDFLFSPKGQEIALRHYLRPRKMEGVDPSLLASFPPLAPTLRTIEDLGGWTHVQSLHFSQGGKLDKVLEGKSP